MKRVTFLFFICSLIAISSSYAQLQYPSELKWIEIKSEHFSVICPEELNSKGKETLNLLESVYLPVSASLHKPAKPISLVINNQSVISNGYATLAPRYMSWYITPFQDAGSSLNGSDWFQNLALHEYRHVVQFDKLDTNLTDIGSDLFGDYGRAFLENISTPQWFFEGDAIYSETVNSSGGRGRLPDFVRNHLALEAEGVRYSYDKALLGSYRNYVPNHYHLGYILTSYINSMYGTEIWNNIIAGSSRLSISPFIFSSSLHNNTGFNLKRTYNKAFNFYDSLWIDAYAGKRKINSGADTIVAEKGKSWTNYTFPSEIVPGLFVALKYGLSDASTLVLVGKNSEQKLANISEIDRIQTNGKKIVWSSTWYDIRWGQKEFADINIFDIITKKTTRITHNQRYFAPAISPSGELIAAIEYNSEMQCSLVIIDAINGELINKFTVAENEFLRMPSWSGDGKQIVMTKTKDQFKVFTIYNIDKNTLTDVTDFTTENITNPVFYKNYILFNSSRGDFDEIHAFDTISKKRYCTITGKYGVYNPSVNLTNNSVAYQNYTTKGFQIEKTTINISNWIELPANFDNYKNYLHHFIPENEPMFSVSEPKEVVSVEKPYNPLLHSIKIHSWHPVTNYMLSGVGMQVYSNDYLNTTSAIAGALYYPKDAATREYLQLSYAGLYPVLSAELSYGQKYEYMNDTNDESDIRKFDEKIANLSASVPLNFSQNTNNTFLTIEGGYFYGWKHFAEDTFYLSNKTAQFSGLYGGIEFENTKNKARRDILPSFGQTASVYYLQTIGNSIDNGSKFTFSGNLYLPGLAKHHTLTLSGGYQKNGGNITESIFMNESDIGNVKGYGKIEFKRFINGGITYTLPLLYPDFNIPAVLFCNRIYSNLFCDIGNYKIRDNSYWLSSVGVDLNFNFYLFRLPVPLEMGIRYAYRLHDNENSFELLFLGLAF